MVFCTKHRKRINHKDIHVDTGFVFVPLQDGGFVRPGWVKMRYTAEGVTVAWHPAAHPLSLPVPVVAAPGGPCEPVGRCNGQGEGPAESATLHAKLHAKLHRNGPTAFCNRGFSCWQGASL